MTLGTIASAQSESIDAAIDPRLVEMVDIIKDRTDSNAGSEAQLGQQIRTEELYLDLIDKIHTASYSRNPEEIRRTIETFHDAYIESSVMNLERVTQLYQNYAELLENAATSSHVQASLTDFAKTGNWFEKYITLTLLAGAHATESERQAALQKAQLALSVIPISPDNIELPYVNYAKKRILSFMAHLHNLQGNSELAIRGSLEYLQLTQGKPDSKTNVDLINNLIYSYGLARNHDAQLYLSEQLLQIEKNQTSSVAGLSEMRIANVMNLSGRYEDGLLYAKQSIEKGNNPIVARVARVYEAVALVGLGRVTEAREAAKLANVDLSPNHILKTETSESNLYLAFLLAQREDPKYAAQIYNRQLDVKAQKFYANNSRDTTAMLAQLENSHERQAEREAAAVRESELQAITINRQRKLNRALTGISLLMGLALTAGLLFSRYRGKVLRKLEIKTREAASAEKLKTEFLGMISHELRTPLNGIIGISDFLANHHQDDDIREKTSIVLKSGYELLSVVEALTDMARIDAGQLQLMPHDADLAKSLAIIPDDWKDKAAGKGLAFTAYIDPAITQHHVDEERLLQCLNILLANAISFTDSGRVHLHITAAKTSPMSLTAIVADTGQGMSERVQSRLFTPFMQADTSRKRSHMGTGLSLAIAHALAKMMDGSLTVVSREGRGSEFALTVPLTPLRNTIAPAIQSTPPSDMSLTEVPPAEGATPVQPSSPQPIENKSTKPVLSEPQNRQTDTAKVNNAAPQAGTFVDLMQPAAQQKHSLHGAQTASPPATQPAPPPKMTPPPEMAPPKRILIVDDIDGNRDILRLILETKGHLCREAADGRTALYTLDHQSFDLVIMDIHMAPMDGVEAIERIRSSGKYYANVPIIALTADNDPQINADCIEAGANLFLTKPVKQTELLRSLDLVHQFETQRILSRPA